jgi:uncharacterized protein involved in exopolysaccharide biosynthesis
MTPDSTAPRGDLIDLVLFLWAKKWIIVGCALVFGAAAAGWALLMKPVYRAEVVVLPTDSDRGGLGGIASQLGGLASLAGVDVSGAGSKEEIVAFLRSRAIAEEFIRSQDLLPVLFAKGWDPAQKKWTKKEPTLGDGYILYNQQIRAVAEDRRTGLITVRIEWTDRERVAEWANGLVVLANARMRERAIRESTQRLDFLNKALNDATSVELRDAIYKLTEAEVKSRMMASVEHEFALRVVDPAVTPDSDKRVRPWRSLMVLIGLVAGGIVGIFIVLLRNRLGERAGARRA